MCEICQHTPCLNRCPNQEEVVIGECDFCGREIYEGDSFYKGKSNEKFCEIECVLGYFNIEESWRY